VLAPARGVGQRHGPCASVRGTSGLGDGAQRVAFGLILDMALDEAISAALNSGWRH
jgi:hypothetical protein